MKSKYSYEAHRISVIIPAYNAQKQILNTLDALSQQLVKELEIIIVDDGSTDQTRETVCQFMGENPHMDITYVHQENAGPGVARNTGIDLACGEYIAFCDADDTLPMGAYSSMYHTAKRWNCDIVVGSYMRRVDAGAWYIPDFIKSFCDEMEGINCAGDYISVIKCPSLWNRLYKRSFLQSHKIRFLPENHGEDVIFNLDAVKYAERIYTTDAIVYYYSKCTSGKQTLSTAWSYKSTASRIRAIKNYIGYFDSIGDVCAEMVYFETEINYFMDGFKRIADAEEKNELFEEFKELIRGYAGNKKYEPMINRLLKLELDTVLLIPYDAYLRYMALSNIGAPQSVAVNNGAYNHKEAVLKEFRNGKGGLRYIIKLFIFWFLFKIKK